jgi:DNA-binding MarR family transcriptional regulator
VDTMAAEAFPLDAAPDAINRLGALSRELRRGYAAFHAFVFLGAFDLDVGQQDVLELLVLEYENGCSMGRLAEAMRVTPSSATRAVNRLIARGLVSRSQSDADRRQFVVRATAKGTDLFQRLYAIGSPRFRQLIGGEFTDSEVDEFVGYLARYVRMQDEAGRNAAMGRQ